MTLPIGGKLFKWQPIHQKPWASQLAPVVKNLSANAGDVRGASCIPESGRSYEGGHGNPCQYSCLGNPMDRGAWWPTMHRGCKNLDHWSKLTCTHAWGLEGTLFFKCWKKRTMNTKFCIRANVLEEWRGYQDILWWRKTKTVFHH